MKSRRLIRGPLRPRTTAYHNRMELLCASQHNWEAEVRSGSLADIADAFPNVCFNPESGQTRVVRGLPSPLLDCASCGAPCANSRSASTSSTVPTIYLRKRPVRRDAVAAAAEGGTALHHQEPGRAGA